MPIHPTAPRFKIKIKGSDPAQYLCQSGNPHGSTSTWSTTASPQLFTATWYANDETGAEQHLALDPSTGPQMKVYLTRADADAGWAAQLNNDKLNYTYNRATWYLGPNDQYGQACLTSDETQALPLCLEDETLA